MSFSFGILVQAALLLGLGYAFFRVQRTASRFWKMDLALTVVNLLFFLVLLVKAWVDHPPEELAVLKGVLSGLVVGSWVGLAFYKWWAWFFRPSPK